MKKVLSVLVAMVLTLCLCSFASAEETAYHVGICQLVQHVALDAATQGFQDALKEKLGDAIVFDLQNASGDTNTCSTIMNNFVSNGVNLIMANATPALQAAVASISRFIPRQIMVQGLLARAAHISMRCATDFDGGTCTFPDGVPDTESVIIRFFSSTCIQP